MLWIGLTGGIATGKSTSTKVLREWGYPVVDADAIAREVVSPGSKGLEQVVAEFGSDILTEKGELNRPRLGKVVFSDPEKRRKLEQILHPLIQTKVKEQRGLLESQGHAYAFYDVPLLFENHLQDQFDQVVLIYTPRRLQLDRLMQRDGLDQAEAEKRLAAQMDIEIKKDLADHIIDNQKTEVELAQELRQLLNQLD